MIDQQIKKFIHSDTRGGLKKLYDIPESFKVRQIIISETNEAWTVRGLHHAQEPNSESKIVTCIQGSVIWVALENIGEGVFKIYSERLKSDSKKYMFIPKGRIHGCIICEDNTLIQLVSDNDHDGNNSVHYNWGIALDEICKIHGLKKEDLWDSEKDVGYQRVNLGIKKLLTYN